MNDGAPLGYIKLARKAFDVVYGDAFWLEPREFSRWEAWVDVIQMACFSAYRHATRFGVVDLERGEFVVSRRHLAKRWNWTEKKVRVWLATLQKRAQLEAKRETEAGTVYLVVNYDTYQGASVGDSEDEGQGQGPARAQQGPKREAGKAVKAVTTLSDSPDVRAVLEHYLELHPRRRVSAKDSSIVAKALRLGYSSTDLCEALDGNAADEWHRDKHKHELGYVLRDTGKIDGFRVRAELSDDTPIVDEHGCLTAYGERMTRPANG